MHLQHTSASNVESPVTEQLTKPIVEDAPLRDVSAGKHSTAPRKPPKRQVEVFHNIMWSKYKGGVFTQLHRLANTERIEIHFIHIAQTQRARTILSDVDYSYHKYPYETLFRGAYEDVPWFLMMQRTFVRVLFTSADLVVLPGYDRAEYWGMLMAAILGGKRRAVFCDSTASDHHQTVFKSLLKRIFFSCCHGFFAYGSRSSEYLAMHGVPAGRIYTRCQAAALPHDYTPARALAMRLEYLAIASEPRLLYVGRLAPEKGIDTLLEAFGMIQSEFPMATLTIVGSGPMGDILKAMVEDSVFGSRVKWRGSMNMDELSGEYLSATCLVLPSSSEPWGLVVNEALSYGCPAIASDSCGCVPELIVDSVTGFSFVTGDAVDLASRIRSSIALFTRNAQSAIACIEHMRRFTPEIAAFQMLTGCRKILNL